jgi:hypothetical protein
MGGADMLRPLMGDGSCTCLNHGHAALCGVRQTEDVALGPTWGITVNDVGAERHLSDQAFPVPGPSFAADNLVCPRKGIKINLCRHSAQIS